MQVGILGSGDVGKALGKGFVTLGHDVKIGSREVNNENALAWANEMGGKASVGTFSDAASFGEVVVLATLGVANESALRLAGPETLRGKVVIDATNPLDFSGGMAKLAVSGDDSAGERVQRLLPDAHIVKAFNTVGNALMFRPELAGGPPDMFIAGNSDDAKKKVSSILSDFGWGVGGRWWHRVLALPRSDVQGVGAVGDAHKQLEPGVQAAEKVRRTRRLPSSGRYDVTHAR